MPRALWALYLLCVIVVVTGVWAAQARVDIVAKAPGKVAPGGHEQVIASLEGGLLAELVAGAGSKRTTLRCLAAFAVWLGLTLSYHWGTAGSATMALVAIAVFFLVLALTRITQVIRSAPAKAVTA